ncbi:MAG TPA: DUF6580 family putative transport protein [Rhodanobacter sp.]|nr:DUF6580 family putative transport protein [Rhodanobacter sp.]
MSLPDGMPMNLRQPESTTPLISPRTLVLCVMMATVAGYRLIVHFVPGLLPYNFTPIEAMALFGGACFTSRRLAFLMPLAVMLVSDIVIAFSLPASQIADWYRMAPVIYACIALTAVAGFALRGRVRALNVVIAAVASATGFYLVTNAMVWLLSGAYAMTSSGLLACMVAGLPFYQHGTLPGTLLWSGLLFGSFALLSRRYLSLTAAPLPG